MTGYGADEDPDEDTQECGRCNGRGYHVRTIGATPHRTRRREECDRCDGEGRIPRRRSR